MAEDGKFSAGTRLHELTLLLSSGQFDIFYISKWSDRSKPELSFDIKIGIWMTPQTQFDSLISMNILKWKQETITLHEDICVLSILILPKTQQWDNKM